MKSRKIWSIPIAALALVLMLAGALAVSSIVQAQTAGNRLIYVDDAESADGIIVTDGSGDIAKITIPPNKDADPTKGEPAITNGLGDDEKVSGYEISSAKFTIDSNGKINAKDAQGKPTDIGGVNSVTVKVYVDLDKNTDSGKGPPDKDGVVQPGKDNDRDEVNTVTLTIYKPQIEGAKVNEDVKFALIPGKAITGDRVLAATAGGSQFIQITGLGGKAKIVGSPTIKTGTNKDANEKLSGNFAAKVEGSDKVYIEYASLSDNKEILAAAGKSEVATLQVEVAFDGVEADTTLKSNVLIYLYDVLELGDAAADGTHKFSVQSNASAGTQIGTIAVTGARGDEEIDLISSGEFFDVTPRPLIGTEHAVITVKNGVDLSDQVGMSETFTLTANGSLVATRTDAVEVSISVTASNDAPDIIDPNYDPAADNGNGLLSATFAENDMSEGVVVSAKTGTGLSATNVELYDFSKSVDDDNTLDFALSGADASLFTLNPSTGVLTLMNDIGMSRLVPPDKDEKDNVATTVDESMDYYQRDDGGVFSNGKNQTNLANDDVSYDLVVTVKDRANEVTIPVKLTIDVNEPAVSGATGRQVAEYSSNDAIGHEIFDLNSVVIDPDEDTLTYVLANDELVAPAVTNGLLPSTLPFSVTDGGKIVSSWTGLRVEDDLIWHLDVKVNDGFDNTGEFDDDNDSTTALKCCADDAVVQLAITLKAPEPQEAGDLSYTVAEHAAAGKEVGSVAKDENGAPVISDATNYSITHATGGAAGADGAAGTADDDFGLIEMDDDFLIVVKKGRDFEGDDKIAMPNTLTLIVEATGPANEIRGQIIVGITVTNVNEAPEFMAAAPGTVNVDENAQPGAAVGSPITASDVDAGDSVSYSITETNVPFSVDSAGQISVSGALVIKSSPYTVTLVATDSGGLMDTHSLEIAIGDVNDPPTFNAPSMKTASIPEDAAAGTVVATYDASDVDGSDTIQGIHYVLRDADDLKNFEITSMTTAGEIKGILKVKAGADLDVDAAGTATEYSVEVNVCDADNACNELIIKISVTDVNDSSPVFNSGVRDTQPVVENTARGTMLGDYSATDADASAAFNTVSYDLSGLSAKSFYIDAGGTLRTLEALDADSGTPCGATGCSVEVIASDGENSVSMDVVITVSNAEDSVSTFDLSKANPVPGVTMGNAATALGDAKEEMFEGSAVPESPADLPATDGDAPMNFVDTQWANWGSVLRIAVTSQSPDANCGNGNQCVKVIVASDSADETIVLEAYRSAEKDNLFIAAVMPVSGEVVNGDYSMESSIDAYNRMNPGATSVPSMYKHDGGGVARLEVDEEDEITIEFGNLRGTIDVENENPEFSNFAPEHESAFDDGDVDYTFTITDPVSGIPDPEDLPDTDGDGDYMPVVAIISGSQCHSEPSAKYSVQMYAGNSIWCASAPEIREIVDDRDFDEIDDGFEVETKIVLPENRARYVTFIACDAAGNCAMYTPDENETEEALAKITIDTEEPELVEARTGIKWDATDSEYDDDRSFIQLLFEDLTALNPDTIETDDFVVEGHTIKDVHWYDVSDGDDDTAWGDDDKGTTPSRFAMGGQNNKRNHPLRQSIRNAVFIELEDELAADETPDVTVVPNGIEDSAGNEQDDGDKEADDWIAPSFTVVSIVSPGTPEGSSNVLAGDGDEVVVTLTADERIQQTRPKIDVTYVNAPAGCVNTGNRTDNNPYDRGEIKTGGDCGGSATGGTLGTTIEKVSNTEWVITIDEPGDTGYYNFYVYANDRSAQANKGSEGIAPTSIVGDFFERDGDVNSGDAHYFQGDINLGNPGVRVSGVQIEDTEPTVEFKTPLFVELDFTRPYTAMCDADDDDDRDANCLAESDEYAKDSFDSVTVTSFVLNGVDMTDSVKTTDNETFLVSIDGIGIGDHEIEVQAMDQAGNTLDKSLSIEFEVEERDPFSRRLNPGWNLVSLPGEPADSDISVVFGSNVEVRTVYTYDPIIPGGWMVAVRETLDSDWQGDLMDITARRGYWVLSDAIQDWEVSIPRLAGGAVGSGTPIQPPVIGLYAGWNLIPVVDVRGGALDDGKSISATAYLNSLDDGLDLARVLGFNTITNTWTTVLDPDDTSADAGELRIGSGYWVFVREAASLVPGGIAQ